MQWIEAVSLVRKLYVLLNTTVPHIEATLAQRAQNKTNALAVVPKDPTLNGVGSESHHLESTLVRILTEHNDQLHHLADSVEQLRRSNALQLRSQEELERQVSDLTVWNRVTSSVAVVLLLVCTVLLTLLYLHRPH